MKTRNLYSYPIEEKHIKKIVTKESPAHRKYRSEEGWIYDLRKAVDFLCDIGIPIKASLDGEVVVVVNNLNKNYDKWEIPTKEEIPVEEQDGNYVVLKHANGEFSIYSHMKYKSIKVKKGQCIKTGDIIGITGITGWSIKPHLHFMVFKFSKPKPAMDFVSLEIKWKRS